MGRESIVALAAAPSTAELTRAEQTVHRGERHVEKITARLAQTHDNTRTRVRIGLGLRQLLPHEVNDLHRVISAPQRQLAIELQRAANKLALEHVRDLVHWARAPQLAIPASAARAFRGLLHDRTVERGSH